MRKSIAKEYLELTKIWSDTDKETILNNVKKYICIKNPEMYIDFKTYWNSLTQITGAKKHTVYAWLNKSRSNVKIPLIKLCMIADAIDIDVVEFFK